MSSNAVFVGHEASENFAALTSTQLVATTLPLSGTRIDNWFVISMACSMESRKAENETWVQGLLFLSNFISNYVQSLEHWANYFSWQESSAEI